ncbi:GGDEF domain-containing protein [Colwellia sp. 6M3]|jgi:diguanylate cyclase (GGDEF)-like protein|uniref:sensor domain-containing diguanylate cyclase n=1 Tax=Colwellia sp. 6M3 TaxID=2759849 RepID=UPI0015F400D9|nr:sensor domain-containing diguanylate cyclase [Colwellia sp. 6M3]MBA6415890.1 GGDEF domain-containing protein [Colwellia sp. 6M3]|tara:strand:+ start:10317 stop:11753 length:1437 start_codon:yes stop_codon:yes gene_type:complete
MKLGNKFDRYIAVIFFVTIVTVILTSYFTLKDVINSHNKQVQSAVTPLFSLVTSEILRPLNVANFMAKNQFIIDYAEQAEIEKGYLVSYLEKIAKSYNMVAFIALEKHDVMLNSTGKETSLDGENVEWFHRLKNLPGEQFTDIGNAEAPHLYFDNKIHNMDGDFIGFTGVALELSYFARKFQEYNDRFGFELYFVDSNNIITLSSNKMIKSQSHHRTDLITRLSDLPWYQSLIKNNAADNNLTSEVMYTTDEGLLISQMPIQELNWRMFIVSPPASEQSAYWKIFIGRFMLFFIIVIVFYMALLTIINYLKSRLIKHAETDHLTQLPNRSHVHWRFDEIVKNNENLCLVLADIDNFKNINDTYGHLVGDDVLRIISEQLSQTLRKIDVVGRWGGEEFVMVLPDTSAEQALIIVERIRKNIAAISFPISTTSGSFTTTISFGICELPIKSKAIEDYIKGADKALYQAKHNGRNQSVIFN